MTTDHLAGHDIGSLTRWERTAERMTSGRQRRARRGAALVALTALLGTGLAAPTTGSPAAAAVSAVPPFIPANAPWLTTVNYFRAMSGLAPVVEEPAWSAGAYQHSRYMVENGTITHDEVNGGPWWTAEGDVAGNSGNVAVSSNAAATARSHVELWMTGPFHAIGVLRHNLQRVGFGLYSNPSAPATWRSGATLDVIQGMNWAIPRPSAPTLFPGDGTTTNLSQFITESPNPLTFCGWSGTAGLPVIALMPEAPVGARTWITGPGGPIEVCTLTSANTSGTAKAILQGDHAVVAVPRTPLEPGRHEIEIHTASRVVTWSFTVDPAAATGSYPPLPTTSIVGATSQFQPIQPFRLLDTRNGDDGGRLRAGEDRRIDVAGRGGVPADALAISANFAIADPAGPGHLTVYPCSGARPLVATLNHPAGRAVSNQATVPLDSHGDLCVSSHADADLVIDVNGAFTTSANGRITPLTPTRVLDTRTGLGAHGRVPSLGTIELPLRGVGGVGAGASAVLVNLTAVDPADSGYVTAYPCGALPVVSTLNTFVLETRPNSAIVPLSPGGSICLFSTSDTDLVVDVNGFVDVSATRRFVPLQPIRLLDTREPDPALSANLSGARIRGGEPIRFGVAGTRGIPTNAKAASINVAATESVVPGFVTVYPCGSLPMAANLNFGWGATVANGAQVALDPGGGLCLYSNTTVHVIVDVNGVWI